MTLQARRGTRYRAPALFSILVGKLAGPSGHQRVAASLIAAKISSAHHESADCGAADL